MIVVDSSVWIDLLNGIQTDKTKLLTGVIGTEPILVGDLVLCEVLQGLRTEREARNVEAELRNFEMAPMLSPDLAVQAAMNYRSLRGLGVTVRKTVDLIIATFCIAGDHVLLHNDRDFDPFERHLGLRVLA